MTIVGKRRQDEAMHKYTPWLASIEHRPGNLSYLIVIEHIKRLPSRKLQKALQR